MTDTKLKITVEELAELIRERMEEDFTFDKNSVVGCARLDQEALAQARRMLAAANDDEQTTRRKAAADALYETLSVLTNWAETQFGPSKGAVLQGRAALAQAEGKVE